MKKFKNSNTEMGKRKLLKICVIAYPLTKHLFLFNLLEILEAVADKLYVITGNIPADKIPNNRKYHLINFKMETVLRRHLPFYIAFPIYLFNYIIGQLKMSYNLFKISKNVDIVIFYLGYHFLLPMLGAKVLRKKSVMIVTGSSKSDKMVYNNVFYHISRTIERLSYSLSDILMVESINVIDSHELNRYRKKIPSFSSAPYVNLDRFKKKKDFRDRRNLIGYIGRLSLEKGVMNFTKAIPLILKERSDLEFLIGGNGPLFDEIKHELKTNGSYDKVEFTGWISLDELPKYLNELKLIVAPSYTEGGVPAIIMEAMACGTVSLVTPVAGVDVIKEGESGFILDDNSPECIAENVIRALEHPNLDNIISNAYNLVEEKFSYESTVKRYRNMLYKVLSDKIKK